MWRQGCSSTDSDSCTSSCCESDVDRCCTLSADIARRLVDEPSHKTLSRSHLKRIGLGDPLRFWVTASVLERVLLIRSSGLSVKCPLGPAPPPPFLYTIFFAVLRRAREPDAPSTRCGRVAAISAQSLVCKQAASTEARTESSCVNGSRKVHIV